ncbi:MAG: thiamine phosphate synthase [Pyrinomonadaceae bacterium]
MSDPSAKRAELDDMGSPFLHALANTRLYALTDRPLSGLSHAEQLVKLSAAGLKLVQLREKVLSPSEFYKDAELAVRVARQNGVTVIVNDRVDLAVAVHANGVHVGQDDLSPEVARRLMGDDAIIGVSTHNLDQAREAAKLPVNYVAIGPIFATQTKQSADAEVGLIGLRRVREALQDMPLVAIGGITAENGKEVLTAGADAIAVIKTLWNSTGTVAAQAAQLLHLS